ncbi:MAG: response regulator [Desulfobacteraceae bacterium]|nr:response regulator [Desulfobacteraceae bacterium]
MVHILIIDDDEQILTMLKQAIERKGYKVTTAINGKIGIKLYKETLADVVITDIVMPEMEGLEAIRTLRKKNKDIKIIALSGGGFVSPDEYLKLAKQFGAKYAFAKPVNLKELIDSIKELTE